MTGEPDVIVLTAPEDLAGPERSELEELLRGEHDRWEPIPDPGAAEGRRVGLGSSTEELVEISGVEVCSAYALRPGGTAAPLHLRSTALTRLLDAGSRLPGPLSLVVLDGWRSLEFQELLTQQYGDEATEAGFVTTVHDSTLTPPHVTGGAVDLTLGYAGVPLALGTDFDDFTDRAHLTAFEGAAGESHRDVATLRRILYHSMTAAGFAPYALEWWHFSYGDQHWAAYYQRDEALFGQAHPTA